MDSHMQSGGDSLVLKLNLGCGKDIRPGWINIDRIRGPGVDVVLDLDQENLPFSDGIVDEVLASHILEHLVRWEDLLVEIHRVLRPRGRLEIHVPYGFKPYIGHIRFFLPWTIDQFCVDRPADMNNLQAKPLFRKVKQRINHYFPVRWQIRHIIRSYLGIIRRDPGIDISYQWPIGRKIEIVWILEKVG